jgi:hypothetical protein
LDAVVLLPSETDVPITIAGTGVDVWELLDTWRTVESIAGLLAARYQATPEQVVPDVAQLVGQLQERRALDMAAGGDGPTSG